MEIWDIIELKRDEKQDNLYSLFERTHETGLEINFKEHTVEEDEEMRIDLISFRLYGNVNQVGFLLNYNEISNPLNIRKGDIIKYCNLEILDRFKLSPQSDGLVEQIVPKTKPNKSTRTDKNREEFEKNDNTIPPNLQETPTPPFRISGGSIIIGG